MVTVVDDTLREGMQTPGLMFSKSEKLRVAEGLLRAGVTRLVVSYPPAHRSEEKVTLGALKLSRRLRTRAEIFGLGRAVFADVDKIASTGAHIALHLPFDGRYEEALAACEYAKKQFPDRLLSVALVDVASFPLQHLLSVARKFDNAKADCIELPDTTGSLHPVEYGKIIGKIKSNVSAKVSVHCHNDMGLAVANSLSGIEEGADYVDCTVLGLGERNGICDLAVVVEALETRGVRTGIRVNEIKRVYIMVNKIVRRKLNLTLLTSNYPIYGAFLRTHTAGTHALDEERFRGTKFSVNVYCGKALIRKILRQTHLKGMSDSALSTIVGQVKGECARTGRALSYERVIEIADSIVAGGVTHSP